MLQTWLMTIYSLLQYWEFNNNSNRYYYLYVKIFSAKLKLLKYYILFLFFFFLFGVNFFKHFVWDSTICEIYNVL